MNSGSQNNQTKVKYQNVLESLKSIETNVKDTIKEDVFAGMQRDVVSQLFGVEEVAPQGSRSGTIEVGESISMTEVLSGERENIEKQRKQVFIEKRILHEERIRVQEKTNELRMQLKVIMDEVLILSQSTQELGSELQLAAMQAPIEPGEYHISFFENILSFITSFRKKIEKASVWLHATNKRAQKKNYWAQYKKHGAKLLLSSESYSSRSAG